MPRTHTKETWRDRRRIKAPYFHLSILRLWNCVSILKCVSISNYYIGKSDYVYIWNHKLNFSVPKIFFFSLEATWITTDCFKLITRESNTVCPIRLVHFWIFSDCTLKIGLDFLAMQWFNYSNHIELLHRLTQNRSVDNGSTVRLNEKNIQLVH